MIWLKFKMNKMMNLIGIKSRKASEKKVEIDTKNKVLNFYAKLLDKENKSILRENSKDIKFAQNKGIKENLNLSKIFQQFQAFRLKLKYDVELRIFALTEMIPASGYSKQIELIEFDVDEKLIDAKEGEMLLEAIRSVKVKKRHSFRIR